MIPAFRNQRQKVHKVMASLSYIVRLSQNICLVEMEGRKKEDGKTGVIKKYCRHV